MLCLPFAAGCSDEPAPPTPVKPVVTASPPAPAAEPKAAEPKAEEPKAEEPRPDAGPADSPDVAREVKGYLAQATRALLTGDPKSAVGFLNSAKKLQPDNGKIHRGLGRAYERLDRNKSASESYRKYLKLNPRAPDRSAVESRLRSLR